MNKPKLKTREQYANALEQLDLEPIHGTHILGGVVVTVGTNGRWALRDLDRKLIDHGRCRSGETTRKNIAAAVNKWVKANAPETPDKP